MYLLRCPVLTPFEVFSAPFQETETCNNTVPRDLQTSSQWLVSPLSQQSFCAHTITHPRQVSEREIRARGSAKAREDPRRTAVLFNGARLRAGGAHEGQHQALSNQGGRQS